MAAGATDLFDLDGRVAIVTGGTRGIGRAIAEGFVVAGANVVVASRKQQACAETEAALRGRGGEALGVAAHLGDLDSIEALVAQTVERFGAVDIVVNNAATAVTQGLGQFTPELWAKSFDVNLRGPVFLVQTALPHLTRSRCASVINTVSVGAYHSSPEVAMYSAAKAAMVSFTRSMAKGFAPLGIRVNALCPGPVDTDMMRANPEEAQQAMADSAFQQRMGRPSEFVGPAIFLASDASSFVTGATLVVAGGADV